MYWEKIQIFGENCQGSHIWMQVENYGFQKTTILFLSLYIFILIVDSLEIGYILKYAKLPEKEGYSNLEGKEIEKTEKQNMKLLK